MLRDTSRPCIMISCYGAAKIVDAIYLRQVNEVNGGDNVFVPCVSVCLCVCARAQLTGQSDQFKMGVKCK